jgi:hypothetical protein
MESQITQKVLAYMQYFADIQYLMKRLLFSILTLATLTTLVGLQEPPPEASISNGLVHAKLYLPDANNGYYRGARFDWAGVIYDLEYKGHHYFGKWFARYEPTLHDAIMGPVDSFNPIGYDDAKTGEGFLRIGVGILEKPDEPQYTYSKSYKIKDSGKWKVSKKSSSVEFTHVLKDNKYQYTYTKKLGLTKDKPELIIEYKLKNTGDVTIETDVYNHNFFVMDHEATGPDFIVKFPFTPQGEPTGRVSAGAIEGNAIVYKETLTKGENFAFFPLTGHGSTSSDYDLQVENNKTGMGVRIIGDKPFAKLNFWSAPTTLCPEPFIHIKVEPGKETTWSLRYEFYTKP